MLFDTPAVMRLIQAFRVLPGVGKRSAERYALYILTAKEEQAKNLAEAILEARRQIRFCSICRNLTDCDPCAICRDPARDPQVVCVVESPSGAYAIERAGAYKGTYYVLHGVLNPLEGIGPHELALDCLFERIQQMGIREVILATNATAEGEATANYIAQQVQEMGIAVSRIAHGVPMGGGLEYVDPMTLTHALEGRTRLH
jgi:recombination protein RecR